MTSRHTHLQWLVRTNLHLALTWHWLVVLVAVLMTVLAAHYARQIALHTSFADLLPQDSETVQTLREVSRKIGGIGYVTILLHSPNLDKVQAFIKELSVELERLPHVRYVNYRVETEFYKKYNPLFIDIEDLYEILKRLEIKRDFAKLKINPFYFSLNDEEDKAKENINFDDIIDKYRKRNKTLRFDHDGWYINKASNITLVLVKPDGIASDIDYSRRLVQAVQETVARVNPQRFDPTMRVEYTDRYVIRPLEQDALQADLRTTTIVTLISVVLLITAYTRKLRTILVIGLPLVMGVIWTFGFASLVLGHVNLITGFLLAILLGLGIDYGIHIFCRFLDDRQAGLSVPEAVLNLYQHTARASLTAAVTSSIAFYTLMFTEFRGLSEFGLIAGTGLLLCLLAMVYVLPCLLVLWEKCVPIRAEPTRQQQAGDLRARRFPRPVWTIGVFLGAMALSVLVHQQLEMEYNFKNLQVKALPVLQLQEIANQTMGRSLTPTAIMARSYAEAEEMLAIIARIQEDVRRHGGVPAIGQALALPSLIPHRQEEKIDVLHAIQTVLHDKIFQFAKWQEHQDIQLFRDSLDQTPLRTADIPESIRRIFTSVDSSESYMVWVFPSVSLSNGKEVKRFVNEMRHINDYRKNNPVKLSGEEFVFADILHLVEKDIMISIVTTFSAVFFILLIDFRSIRDVIIVMIPLIAGLIITIGVMIITHTKVNFINIVIFPSLIGLGVDNGVYFYQRYVEDGPHNILKVLRSTGAAICLTTFTSLIGFGTLVFARHGALASLGWLAVIGLSAAWLTALVMFPALLQVLEDRQKPVQGV